jgi:hypothetical protein
MSPLVRVLFLTRKKRRFGSFNPGAFFHGIAIPLSLSRVRQTMEFLLKLLRCLLVFLGSYTYAASDSEIRDVVYTATLGGRLLRQVTKDGYFYFEECTLIKDNSYFSKYEGKQIGKCQKITPNYVSSQNAVERLNWSFSQNLEIRLTRVNHSANANETLYSVFGALFAGPPLYKTIRSQMSKTVTAESAPASRFLLMRAVPGIFGIGAFAVAIELQFEKNKPSLETILQKGNRNADIMTEGSIFYPDVLYIYCRDSLLETDKDMAEFAGEA